MRIRIKIFKKLVSNNYMVEIKSYQFISEDINLEPIAFIMNHHPKKAVSKCNECNK